MEGICMICCCRQCEDTLPDGSVCGPEDHVTVADPESCFKYYKCAEVGILTMIIIYYRVSKKEEFA